MTLTEFLLARIAEDEAHAGAWVDPVTGLPDTSGGMAKVARESMTARVLAECEAKRRIVEECQGQGEQGPSAAALADIVLCDLASVYADHPDYREEWKP